MNGTVQIETRNEYEAWMEGFKMSGGEVGALFMPTPEMIDFTDPVVIEVKDGAVANIGYLQSNIRVFVNDVIGIVGADFI